MHEPGFISTYSVRSPDETKEILSDLLKLAEASRSIGNKVQAVEAISDILAYIDALQHREKELHSPPANTAATGAGDHVGGLPPHETAAVRWGLDIEAAPNVVRRLIMDKER